MTKVEKIEKRLARIKKWNHKVYSVNNEDLLWQWESWIGGPMTDSELEDIANDEWSYKELRELYNELKKTYNL